jgi:chromosome segregation ATPase
MLRMRFFPGLLVGLLIGLPLGAILALHLQSSASTSEIPDLKARLERSEREKEGLNRQLGEFQATAERMTTSFAELERRFKGLEDELHAREVSPAATLAPSPAPPES